MRHTTPVRSTTLPPCDPPSELRLPRVDFCVGCYCATCDMGMILGLPEPQLAQVWRRWWERVILARGLFLRSETMWVCRWQLRQLTDANGGESLRALRAKLDVAGVPGPNRLTGPTRPGELQL